MCMVQAASRASSRSWRVPVIAALAGLAAGLALATSAAAADPPKKKAWPWLDEMTPQQQAELDKLSIGADRDDYIEKLKREYLDRQ